MCYCKIWQTILLAIIVVFTFWDSTVSWLPSKWVVLVAVLGLLLHNFMCKCCVKGTGRARRAPRVRRKRRR